MRKVHGVSLWGMVAIFVVLGVITYLIGPKLVGASKQERIEKVRNDFEILNGGLKQYKFDNGAYPSTDQGLDALVTEPSTSPVPQYWKSGGYVDVIPQDPWGAAYQYENNDGLIRLYSYGSSGKNGGTEIDASNVDSQ